MKRRDELISWLNDAYAMEQSQTKVLQNHADDAEQEMPEVRQKDMQHLYETRRHAEKIPTWDVLHKFPHDYKVIFVGDATMSPYEITYPGGSVEHWNEEAGAGWMQRVTDIYQSCVWLNPTPERHWDYTQSIGVMKQILGNRMYPLTLEGLDKAMRELVR